MEKVIADNDARFHQSFNNFNCLAIELILVFTILEVVGESKTGKSMQKLDQKIKFLWIFLYF